MLLYALMLKATASLLPGSGQCEYCAHRGHRFGYWTLWSRSEARGTSRAAMTVESGLNPFLHHKGAITSPFAIPSLVTPLDPLRPTFLLLLLVSALFDFGKMLTAQKPCLLKVWRSRSAQWRDSTALLRVAGPFCRILLSPEALKNIRLLVCTISRTQWTSL